MAAFHAAVYSNPDSPTGLNEVRSLKFLYHRCTLVLMTSLCCPQGLNFKEVILTHDQQLTDYYNDWERKFQEESDMSGLCPRRMLPCVVVSIPSSCLY